MELERKLNLMLTSFKCVQGGGQQNWNGSFKKSKKEGTFIVKSTPTSESDLRRKALKNKRALPKMPNGFLVKVLPPYY